MKLYYSKGACSLVPRIIINELKLDCEFELVDLKTKKTEKGTNFLSVNPKGAVPTLELNSGEIITENAVILQYLADNTQAFTLLPSINHIERYRVLEWVNYITTELHKGIGIMFNPVITEELRNQIFIPLVKTKLNYINKQLETHDYLVGPDFTLPDAYLFVMLRWIAYFKIDINDWENLSSYFEILKKRPSIMLSLKQEELG